MEDYMQLKMLFGLWIFTVLLLASTLCFAVELDRYKHVADGVIVSVGRGLTFSNDELEAARTGEVSLGIQLVPNVLHFLVPFSNYQVDTRGHADDVLPIGTLDVKTVGVALTLGLPRRWSPFMGIGWNFYSFDEQFGAAMANIQNTFGAEGYAGLRIRLIEKIFDVAQLHSTITYQFSLLKPGISVPDKPKIENLSLNRHSITFRLELTGL